MLSGVRNSEPAGSDRAMKLSVGFSATSLMSGIENHGPFANDPGFLDRLLETDDAGRLGLTLDTGNYYWFGFPLDELYGLIEKYAPRVKHTHVKNINYPPDLAQRTRAIGQDYGKYCCSLNEGNLDLKRVELEVFADNARAIRLYESLGFEREGLKRRDVIRRGGYGDTVVMGRLR